MGIEYSNKLFGGTGAGLTGDNGINYNPATDTLTVATGNFNNVNVTALATPVVASVTPVLSKLTTITVVAGASLVDGDYFTLNDGTTTKVFEFDSAGGVTAGRVAIAFTGAESAQAIRDLVVIAVNTSGLAATAVAAAADTLAVTLTTPGAAGGANSENVANAGFLVPAWANPTAATTYGYKAVAYLASGASTAASAEVTTAAGFATLSASNYNTVVWGAVTGATEYRLYRTTGGAAPPKLIYTGTATSFTDIGAAGTAQTPATANTTGTVTAGVGTFTGLTATRIPIVGTGGLIGDSNGLRFTGTSAADWTLNVGGFTTIMRDYLAFAYSTAMVKWWSGSAYDTGMARVGINTVGFGANPAAATDGILKAGAYDAVGANGSSASLSRSTELLTLATGATTTATAANLLPATSQVLFITGRVTTAITTAANYTVAPTGGAAWVLSGTATTSLTGLAAGSTFVLVPPSNAVYTTSTANTITVTTNANPGAGAIRLVPFYIAITPPSS